MGEAADANEPGSAGPAKNKNPALYPAPRNEGRFAFLRKGWFWGCLIAVVATSAIAPIAVATQRRLKEVPLPVGHPLRVGGSGGGGSSISMGSGSSGSGGSSNSGRPLVVALGELPKPPSCADLRGDLPTDALSGGQAPAPLRFDGGRLVSAAEGGGTVLLRGVTLPGFESGASFVALPGLVRADGASWESADFAMAVRTLRLLGFNAARLPFAFDGLGASPQDVARPCGGEPPSDAQLAERTIDPDRPLGPGAPPAPRLFALRSNASGGCNAYVPRGPTTLARLLWAADFAVRSGLYVVLDHDPPAAAAAGGGGGGGGAGAPGGPPELDSPLALAAAWQRLAAALACHPSFGGYLSGRVVLGVLPSPRALGLSWGGGSSGSNSSGGNSSGGGGGKDGSPAALGQFALAAMDAATGAFSAAANGSAPPLFLLPGDAALVDGSGEAAAFLGALRGRPYRDSVAVAVGSPSPEAAAGSGSSGSGGQANWTDVWDALLARGLCGPAAAGPECLKVPALATAVGRGGQPGGTTTHSLAQGSGWFWWSYGGDSGGQGGLVGPDGATLQWAPLRWAREGLGLKPWYWRAGSSGRRLLAAGGWR